MATFLSQISTFHFLGLRSKKLAYISLKDIFERFGVPMMLHINNTKNIMSAPYWRQVCEKQAGIHTTKIKPHSPFQNSAKQVVGILNRVGVRLMRNADAPPVLW